MNYGGFAGKVLLVDLTSKEITQEPLDMQLAVKFIGGLGLTLKLAYDNITPGAGALEPENIIAIGAGPLVGTGFPSTSRVFAVSKLPSSDTIGWCGAGGADFGC
ncbi:MAG: aldehyde ferredoxin oxidoreductase, partial [Deltaproteobacteria bacterium]|nr:aldehyde ferredoxin oxidoreductase [Deltaproteobacteria bacterium]